MNRFFLIFAVLALCACQTHSGKPTITVIYSPTLDSACTLVRGGAIKEQWETEMASRKSEFESLWIANELKLIDAAEAITGKSFPSGQFDARLTLCNVPSQSIFGISVNMRYALKSFTPTPVPMRYKVDTLFHELLHVFIAAHPVKDSSLLKLHVSEPERTRDHLHLLALQKSVLIRLNELEALENVIAVDSQLPDGYYKRAWEIVNATDKKYLEYVAEIKR